MARAPLKILLPLALAIGVAPPAVAAETAQKPWPEAWIEIFKLAPGKHEAFLREIALADQVTAAGGQPPTQLYIHETGADWDVLLLKPVTGKEPTPAQEAAMAAKHKELGLPSGPAYFVWIREKVASHTDSKTYGPVFAADWVARLDAWRAEHKAPPGR